MHSVVSIIPAQGDFKNSEQASVGGIIKKDHAKIVIPAQAASPPESVCPLAWESSTPTEGIRNLK